MIDATNAEQVQVILDTELLSGGNFVVDPASGLLVEKEEYLSGNIAQKIFERHKTLTEILISIGVDPEIASDDACKIEHHISDESFEALKKKFNR